MIEIWKKSETFPSDTTERLIQKLTSTQAVASGSGSTTPPYEPGQPPPISPALPPLDPKGLPSVKGLNVEGKYPSSLLPIASLFLVSPCFAVSFSCVRARGHIIKVQGTSRIKMGPKTDTHDGNTQSAKALLTPDIYPSSSSSQMPCSHISTKHASLPLQLGGTKYIAAHSHIISPRIYPPNGTCLRCLSRNYGRLHPRPKMWESRIVISRSHGVSGRT